MGAICDPANLILLEPLDEELRVPLILHHELGNACSIIVFCDSFVSVVRPNKHELFLTAADQLDGIF